MKAKKIRHMMDQDGNSYVHSQDVCDKFKYDKTEFRYAIQATMGDGDLVLAPINSNRKSYDRYVGLELLESVLEETENNPDKNTRTMNAIRDAVGQSARPMIDEEPSNGMASGALAVMDDASDSVWSRFVEAQARRDQAQAKRDEAFARAMGRIFSMQEDTSWRAARHRDVMRRYGIPADEWTDMYGDVRRTILESGVATSEDEVDDAVVDYIVQDLKAG